MHVLTLTVDNTRESRYLLFDEYLDATVRLMTSARHRVTASVPTSAAVVLLRVRSFVADQAHCTFVGARLCNVCGFGSRWVREHQSPGY